MKTIVNCQNCGKEFSVYESIVKSGRGKYCSIDCSYNGKSKKTKEEFWDRLDKPGGESGCWNYVCMNYDKDGYAQIMYRGESYRAHRFAWKLANGNIPAGMHVLHECDNPKCCNPGHLFIGTQQDNMADRNKKGRQAFGTSVNTAVLTERDVVEIRKMLDDGIRQADIAKIYEVHRSTIYLVKNGRNWKNV